MVKNNTDFDLRLFLIVHLFLTVDEHIMDPLFSKNEVVT